MAAVVRVQQPLASQLVIQRGANKQPKAERLHTSPAQLWRLVDGHASIILSQVGGRASRPGSDSLRLSWSGGPFKRKKLRSRALPAVMTRSPSW